MNTQITTLYSRNFPAFQETGYHCKFISNRPLIHTTHRHDFFELFLVLKGNVTHLCDDKNERVNEGEFVFLSPQNTHSFNGQSAELNIFSLSITAERFTRFLSAFDVSPIYGKKYIIRNEKLFERILGIPNTLNRNQILLLNSILSDLFSEIIQNGALETTNVPHALQVAIEKFRSPENIGLGVGRLAELVGVSRMHLGRLLKKYYEKQPKDFILDLRMRLATEYLEKTSYTLNTIAQKIGFNSLSRFHAAFKQYFKCTPNEYRKRTNIPQLSSHL
jgi:AraC family cel operon transcriptional repressor